ncbi:MAG: CoA-transferase [Chloroflexota bacterium]|nr:CoA-transferase [Chloroflexota bacterium]
MALDKQMTVDQVVKQIKNGDTIVIGGWGMIRKPMTIVRAIAKSKLKDLTLIALGGGMDVDILVATGQAKKVISGFIAFEGGAGRAVAYDNARQNGTIEFMEISEYLLISGLKAAAERLPFLPTRSGLGTDILTLNPQIETIKAPYTGEKLVAMPALKADVALIHTNAASAEGNATIKGDRLWDHIMIRAAEKVFVSAEKVVSKAELRQDIANIKVHTPWVTGIVETPNGARPGTMFPEYLDPGVRTINAYMQAALDPKALQEYLAKY